MGRLSAIKVQLELELDVVHLMVVNIVFVVRLVYIGKSNTFL